MKPQFIAMPLWGDLASRQINYTDILTYFTIKSFESNDPLTITAIALKMSADEAFVIQSIKRLKLANRLSETKVMTEKSLYNIEPAIIHVKIPVQLLDCKISYEEKAILLFLRYFCDYGSEIAIDRILETKMISFDELFKWIDKLVISGYIDFHFLSDEYDEEHKEAFDPKNEMLIYELSSSIKWVFPEDRSTFEDFFTQIKEAA
jgi:hypothetical protein